MEKQLIPILRFPDFVDENSYQKYSFADIFHFSTGKNIKQTEASPEFEIPCVRYGELYHMYSEVIHEIINKTNLDKSELLFSKGDEILLPSAGEDPLDIGSASALTLKDIAIGRTINILRPIKSDIYSPIYASYYINQKLRKKISTLAKGSSISNVYNSDLKKLKIVLPEFTEQQKIAAFLTAIDTKITQLTKKKELLEQYKKGIMQKIFNQELRFKDDNGNDFPNWEEKKLGDLLKTIVDNRGKTPPIEKTGIPLIEINSIKNRFVDYRLVSKFVSENVYKEWFRKYLQDGDLLFSTVGKTAICAIYKQDVLSAIAQNLVGLRFEKENFNFMYYLLTENKNNNKFKRIEMGAVQPSVKVSQMINIVFSIPCIEEQTQIANFLSDIDVKIEAINNKIENSITFKKGLLQQLFV